MFIRKSLRNKLLISVILGCLIPYILGGLYLKNIMENRLAQDNQENSNRLLQQVDELIDKALITRVSEIVSFLADSRPVVEADNSLSSYVNFSEGDSFTTPTAVEASIEQIFAEVKKSHAEINFIFLGLENGAYIEYPRFQPKSAYDPRLRPWYLNSINAADILISDPYISQVSKEMIVSFTRRITLKDGQKGVIGLAVKTEAFLQSIGNIRLGETGHIVVLNANDKIVVSPKNPEWLLKTPEELDLNFMQNIESHLGQAFEATIDGDIKVVNALVSEKNGWKIIGILSKQEVIGKSREITNILIVIYLLMMIAVSLLVYIISNKITRPILGISKAINHIAAFDLNFYHHADMSRYAQKNDEIGIIARALGNVQDSFAELNKTISRIDLEIKNIDVREEAPARLTLSKDSPFNHIATSFNMLLERMQEYLNQLKASNVEILEKNEMLTASEEELRAYIDEIYEQRQYIDFLAYHDPLTNLPNRRKFIESLEVALSSKKLGAVIFLDLDNFKSINETMGHVYGDKLLLGVTQRLEGIAAEDVFVSRFGGDEFLVLVQNASNIESIREYVDELLNVFDEPISIENNSIDVTFSMGVSVFPNDSQDTDELIMSADMALYAAKSAGKNGYKFFERYE